jgi:hypothetical protein
LSQILQKGLRCPNRRTPDRVILVLQSMVAAIPSEQWLSGIDAVLAHALLQQVVAVGHDRHRLTKPRLRESTRSPRPTRQRCRQCSTRLCLPESRR